MKKLQESIKEYEEAKQKDENKLNEYLEHNRQVKKESAEKRQEFLSEEKKLDEEKVRLGKKILERVTIITEDEWFMKGLLIASSSCRVRRIFETQVNDEREILDELRERLGHFKRQVTHVFACNYTKDLMYYQYWTPTQWAEGMSCFHSHKNESEAILLSTPEDFKNISYDAVTAFHKALLGDNVIDRLIDRIRDKTDRRIFYD